MNKTKRDIALNHYLSAVGEWSKGDVTNWLRSINLNEYCHKFYSEHVNGPQLLKLTQQDLEQTIKMTGLHQNLLLAELYAMCMFLRVTAILLFFIVVINPPVGNNFNWTSTEICNWLDKLQLSACKGKLLEQGDIILNNHVMVTDLFLGAIDGRTLLAITEEDLLTTYNIDSPLLRSRLLDEIFKLKLQFVKGISRKNLSFQVPFFSFADRNRAKREKRLLSYFSEYFLNLYLS